MADTNSSSNYIFRVHNDGASDMRIEDWGRSAKLDSNKIKTIKDVLKKGAAKIATSVPSPFARMHLFDTAFRMVAEELEGDSVYHQLVSDCLDMFQLLFASGNSPELKYKVWNRAERITHLRGMGDHHPHKLLADSLEMFFTGKFAGLQSITLIYYKNVLLGGTSPLTVFFTSPNWQREMAEAGIHITSTTNHDQFFDMDFVPLHGRDPLFVEFMYRFYLAYRNVLSAYCVGLAAYIRNTVARFRKDLEQKSKDEWADDINNPVKLDADYQRIQIVPKSSTFLQMGTVYGYTVKGGSIEDRIQAESDFLIQATTDRYKQELNAENQQALAYKPLVLARGMNVAGTYTYDNTPWNATTDIRRTSIMDTFGKPVPLTKRLLPGNSGIAYPFLTAEDFLEDALIKMSYKLHKEKFFTGYSGDFQYLLPIKKEYFNYFNIEDLRQNLTILTGDSKITVQLRIPVRNTKGNSHIIFSKDYEFDKVPVAQCNAGMAIFPFYRIMDGYKKPQPLNEIAENQEPEQIPEEVKERDRKLRALNEYTVLLADNNDKTSITDLSFWQIEDVAHGKRLEAPQPEPRTRKSLQGSSYYYKPTAAFDLIELKMKDERQRSYSGLILPLLKEVYNNRATKRYTFAIDFGTSNTHIAYLDNENDKKPKPFEIGPDEMQTVLLNGPGDGNTANERYNSGFGSFLELKSFVDREFVPLIVGSGGSHFSFPIRTATAEKGTFQSETPELFENISLGFNIDIDEVVLDNCRYTTNLKWLFEYSRNTSDPDRIEAFIKELLMLIRNKTITTGGSLEDTKIVWMLPKSMKSGSVDQFTKKWQKAFVEVFKESGARLEESLTESVAPYFFLKENSVAKIKDFADAINIDIGGGTSDIMFFMKGAGRYLSTSFRFAGNDIWGEGFNGHEKDNGFIQNFLDYRTGDKKQSTWHDEVLRRFLEDDRLTSEDVVSLLFHYDHHFKFSESVDRQRPQLKLVLFLHYSAIIYHIVQILERENLNIPRYFTFTGKGSKYLLLMCGKDSLTKFTKILLEAYTKPSEPADKTIGVKQNGQDVEQSSTPNTEKSAEKAVESTVPNELAVILTDNSKEATANGATLFVNSSERNRISKDVIEMATEWGDGSLYTSQPKLKRTITTISNIYENFEFKNAVLKNVAAFVNTTLSNEQIATFLAGYDIKNLGDYSKWLTGSDPAKSGVLHDSFHQFLEGMRATEDEGIAETFFFLPLKDALYELSKKIVGG